MPQPSPSDVHFDRPLSNISIAYVQSQSMFKAHRIFPELPVQKQSDRYYIYDKDAWFRDEMEKRAPSTESVGSGYTLSTDSYICDVWALHKDVDDQVRANEDSVLSSDRDATEYLTQQALIRQERDWVSQFFTTGVWGTDVTGGTNFDQWSDYTSSDPVEDIEDAKETIQQNTGRRANKLVLGYKARRKLRNHPDIIDRVKYTTQKQSRVSDQDLANIFGVSEIITLEASWNDADEGETANFEFIAGNHAALFHVPDRPGRNTPSCGYRFVWRGVSRGSRQTVGIKRFRMESINSDRFEIQKAWDYKRTGQDLGYFFSGAVA